MSRLLIIFILAFCSLFSCKNEKYNKLLDENKQLKLELLNIKIDTSAIIKSIKKSYFESNGGNEKLGCQLIFYRYKPINLNKLGIKNKMYDANVDFYLYDNMYIEALKYTPPSKVKADNFKKMIYSSKGYFSFIPSDTGMYYWSGIIVLEKESFGRKFEIPIEDSIYVLGNLNNP